MNGPPNPVFIRGCRSGVQSSYSGICAMVFSEVNYSDIRYHTCYLDTDQDTDKEEDKVKDHTHFFFLFLHNVQLVGPCVPTASLYRPSSKRDTQNIRPACYHTFRCPSSHGRSTNTRYPNAQRPGPTSITSYRLHERSATCAISASLLFSPPCC